MSEANLTIRDRKVVAKIGTPLMDAIRSAGLAMPQDCGSGACEACRVRIPSGDVDDQGSRCGSSVLACKARVEGDAVIALDPMPLEMKTSGVIRAVRLLAPDIAELEVEVFKPVPYLPGQSVRLSTPGLPERSLCPTLSLEGLRALECLVFHIRIHEGGGFSAALGKTLAPGRKVSIKGPYGAGFLRAGQGRIVLVSSGVGFAPIWSIAVAARLGQPHRPVMLIASAHDPRHLYMRPALEWLAKHGVEQLVLASSGACPMPPARHARAVDCLPALSAGDAVYVAGYPDMVRAVQMKAAAMGAEVYATPFLAAQEPARITAGKPAPGSLLGNSIARFFSARPERMPQHAAETNVLPFPGGEARPLRR